MYTLDGVTHCRTYEGSTDTWIFEGLHRGATTQIWSFICWCRGAFLSSVLAEPEPNRGSLWKLKNLMRKMAQEEFFKELIRIDYQLFIEECLKVVSKRRTRARGHFLNAEISVEEN